MGLSLSQQAQTASAANSTVFHADFSLDCCYISTPQQFKTPQRVFISMLTDSLGTLNRFIKSK